MAKFGALSLELPVKFPSNSFTNLVCPDFSPCPVLSLHFLTLHLQLLPAVNEPSLLCDHHFVGECQQSEKQEGERR